MAGDWMQIDCDLPEKQQIVNIVCQTDCDLDTVLGRIVRFWRWVERHFDSPTKRNATVRTVAHLCGGDEKFWKAVEQEGWVKFDENGVTVVGYQKRFSKSAKRRALAARRASRSRNAAAQQQRDGGVTGASPKEEKRREEKKRGEITLPLSLSTDSFREVWGHWKQHRIEIRKPLKPTMEAAQLRALDAIGHDRAIAAINHTITKGWQGIREPDDGPASGRPSAQSRVDALLE